MTDTGISLENWSHRKFSIGELIGYGHFGNVFRGKSDNNKDVAIKMVRDERLDKDEFLHEAQLLSQCEHENVMSLRGVSFDSKPYWIMVDYMENGNLKDFLANSNNQQALSTSKLIRIAQQISKGMIYLSRKLRIVHRDLAARNVLLDDNLNPKISDFGLARQLPAGKEHYGPDISFTPPLRWSAPEVVTRSIFSFKSDVWSFGILLFEISSRGQRPFGNLSNDEIFPSIILKDSRHFSMLAELPRHFPTELASLMHHCWEKNEKDRPTFSEIFVQLTSMIPNMTPSGTYTYSFCSKHKKFRIAAPHDYHPIIEVGHREEARKISPKEMIEWSKRLKRVKIRSQSDFAVSSQIGRGHFGDIFHGETIEGEDAAIKTIRLNRESPEEFLHEAEILAQFNNKNVTNLLALCFNPLWIVTEFMENADLRTFLVEKEASAHVFSVNTLIGISQQVASGMVHVSNLRIIHQDLAARNVLVGAYQKGALPLIKVADFGLSHQLAPDQEVYKPAKDEHVTFAVRWSAPEVIIDYAFCLQSDVWSFGMILYEIMTHGQMPFKGLPDDPIFKYIVSKDCLSFPMLSNPRMWPSVCPESIKNLMILCWNKDKRQRPSFSEIAAYLDREYREQVAEKQDCNSSYDSGSATSTVSASAAGGWNEAFKKLMTL